MILKNKLKEFKNKLLKINKSKSSESSIVEDKKEKEIIKENVFIKFYAPITDDYSYTALADNLYTTISFTAMGNNIDIDFIQGEWDIVFSELYRLFHRYGLLRYYETFLTSSIFTTLERTKNLKIESFLNNIPLSGDIPDINIFTLNVCQREIYEKLNKFQIDNIQLYLNI